MHVAGFDKGNAAVLILSTDELKILWDVGITVDGVQYRIAVVYIIGDGPGLCKIMCTTGHSLWTIPGRSALYMQVTGGNCYKFHVVLLKSIKNLLYPIKFYYLLSIKFNMICIRM